MVHDFTGLVLIRWDNEDRKDSLPIALAIHPRRNKSQILFYIIWLLLKLAQIYEVIR